jgi:hypothetical protein
LRAGCRAGDDAEVREALEKAFDYRGDITITRKDGSQVRAISSIAALGDAGAIPLCGSSQQWSRPR